MNIQPIPLKILNRKIAFSTLVQYAGKAVQIVLASLTLKLISNFLSQEGYGNYAAITEYVLFFSVVANLGIFGNVVRKMADAPRDGKIFFNALVLRIITAVIFFIIGIIVLIFSGADKAFIIGSALFFGALFFDFITSVCDGALQANYMMGRATFALILGRVINLVLIFYLLKDFGAWHLKDAAINTVVDDSPIRFFIIFFATMIGSLITAALSLYFISKKMKLQWQIDKKFMLEIFKISLPFGIITVTNNLYFRFLPDYFANKNLSGAEFASFNISFRIAQVLSLVSTFLMFSALPGLKEYIDTKNWQKAKNLYRKIWRLFAVGGALLVIVGSLVGPFAMELLTHKKYILPQFWFLLPLMLLLAAISYFYDLILITLFALEKDIWLLKREFLALGLAFLVFGGSVFAANQDIKLLLIILAAIVGETIMVILGVLKIKKEFAMPDRDHF